MSRIIGWACVVLLTAMAVPMVFRVVARYFSDSPNAYTESPSKYMFVWMVVYGSTYVFGPREYISIGFVRNHIPSKTRVVVEMLGGLMVALFATDVMVFGGYRQVISQMIRMDAALQIPIGVIYSVAPVSACFILFYLTYNEMKLTKKLGEI